MCFIFLDNVHKVKKGNSFIDPGVTVRGSRDDIFKIKAKLNGKEAGTINDIDISNLPIGEHTITYTVTDSDGYTVTAERKLIINRTGSYEKPEISTNVPNTATSATQQQNSSVTNSQKYTFTKSLRLGQKGEDVKQLQKFLNNNGFIISTTGPGSKGNESTYFGPATYKALIKFQETYRNEVLSPSGLSKGTGYFGPATIKKVNGL
jgi:peptidoglycan hydrolase-like protein with peptidoglycan-binding domain